jgi:hypothetical protein
MVWKGEYRIIMDRIMLYHEHGSGDREAEMRKKMKDHTVDKLN